MQKQRTLKKIREEFVCVFGYDLWYYFNTINATEGDIRWFAQKIIVSPIKYWLRLCKVRVTFCWVTDKYRRNKIEVLMKDYYQKGFAKAQKDGDYWVDGMGS